MDTILSITQVAEYLGVSERTVYNKVRAGELPAIKVGRLWRVRSADLESWLRARGNAALRGPYPVTEPQAALARESAPPSGRSRLEALLAPLADQLQRRLAFVGLLSDEIRKLGWPPPVIVGGHAVEFYTAGDYPTIDIDLAGASEPVAEVLGGWGFLREGRHFYDDALGLVVEVPAASLDTAQLEHAVGVRLAGVTAYVLGVEDLVVDRLSACKFWGHEDSCTWAQALLKGAVEIDRAYLERRGVAADVLDKLREIEGKS